MRDTVPVVVALETDDPVDDIAVTLSSGSRTLLQVKRSLTLDTRRNSDFASVVNQWKEAIRSSAFNPNAGRLVLVTQIASQPLRDLREALNRGRAEVTGAYRRKERESLNKLLVSVADLTEDQRQNTRVPPVPGAEQGNPGERIDKKAAHAGCLGVP